VPQVAAPGSKHLVLWLVEALACKHLAQGVTSLERYGRTRMLGCSPRVLGA